MRFGSWVTIEVCSYRYLNVQGVVLAHARGEVQRVQGPGTALTISRYRVCCSLAVDRNVNNACLQIHHWGSYDPCRAQTPHTRTIGMCSACTVLMHARGQGMYTFGSFNVLQSNSISNFLHILKHLYIYFYLFICFSRKVTRNARNITAPFAIKSNFMPHSKHGKRTLVALDISTIPSNYANVYRCGGNP